MARYVTARMAGSRTFHIDTACMVLAACLSGIRCSYGRFSSVKPITPRYQAWPPGASRQETVLPAGTCVGHNA